MHNEMITLNSLVADVVKLQTIIKDLDCQERTFKNTVIRYNVTDEAQGVKPTNQ
jgi:hypothetical protein